jgi:hypothetical protein
VEVLYHAHLHQPICHSPWGDDWKRCLVCGLVWLDRTVAISVQQMRRVIGKCKSSINDGFQRLGYSSVVMSDETKLSLMHLIPFLAYHSDEIRQWTIREISSVNLGFRLSIPHRQDQIPIPHTVENQPTIETSED